MGQAIAGARNNALATRAKSSPDATVQEAASPHIASALHTLNTEREGVAALAGAMCDGLGAAFVAAVETIRNARGRVIVTGMGKSGHVGRKIAATLASTGTPAFFVHAADASHGDLGMIKSADVVLAMPATREACPHNLAPTTSSLMQLALGDALAIALLESRGFSAMD